MNHNNQEIDFISDFHVVNDADTVLADDLSFEAEIEFIQEAHLSSSVNQTIQENKSLNITSGPLSSVA